MFSRGEGRKQRVREEKDPTTLRGLNREEGNNKSNKGNKNLSMIGRNGKEILGRKGRASKKRSLPKGGGKSRKRPPEREAVTSTLSAGKGRRTRSPIQRGGNKYLPIKIRRGRKA